MNIAVKLQKCGIELVRIFPSQLTDWIARLIGGLCYFFLKKKRSYILDNLRHILPENPEMHNHLCRRTFENFSLCMTDFFRLGFLKKDEVVRAVIPQGLENLDEAQKLRKGTILITLHIGNWDYAGSYLAARGYPMNALVEETEPEMFRLYTAHREATGLKTFSVARTSIALLDTVKNNRILAVLADRDITKQGTTFSFFSGKRSFPVSIASIIVKRKIPVVIGYMVLLRKKDFDRRYLGVVESVKTFDDENDFNAFIRERFEVIISTYPDQWFVFHPEWIE